MRCSQSEQRITGGLGSRKISKTSRMLVKEHGGIRSPFNCRVQLLHGEVEGLECLPPVNISGDFHRNRKLFDHTASPFCLSTLRCSLIPARPPSAECVRCRQGEQQWRRRRRRGPLGVVSCAFAVPPIRSMEVDARGGTKNVART
jgi:hypothetical protein